MKTIEELRNRAESLKGKFISELKPTLDVKDKGAIGKIIEEFGFGLKNNSEARPDFHEIAVELKVVPLKDSQKGLSVKERTKVCKSITIKLLTQLGAVLMQRISSITFFLYSITTVQKII